MRVRTMHDDVLYQTWSDLLVDELVSHDVDVASQRRRLKLERELIRREMLTLAGDELGLW